MSTQQQWQFAVEVASVYTELEGLYEIPEFTPDNYSVRDATTIDRARTSTAKTYEFNRMKEGQDLALTVDYLPGQTAQDFLVDQVGDNAGANIRIIIFGAARTVQYDVNVLVVNVSHTFASSTDMEAKEQLTINLKVNGDVTKTET